MAEARWPVFCAAIFAVAGCETNPVAPDLSGVEWTDVTAGGFHSCGISREGNAFCWGSNTAGQLGTGSEIAQVLRPQPVSVSALFSDIDAGLAHTCAVTEAGGVLCWGDNEFGQLGNGTDEDEFAPVTVVQEGSFVAVSAGGNHTCALDRAGRLACWGRNTNGQLGRAASEMETIPRPVETDVRFGSVSAGGSHTCAVSIDALVYCWGANQAGQLGVGSASDASFPQAAEAAFLAFRRVAAGFGHTCAVTLQGGPMCWGNGGVGQLGAEGITSVRTPVEVAGSLNVKDVTIGGESWSCAILGTGEPWCWGSNRSLGLEDSAPVSVSGDGLALVRLEAGDRHLCGLTGDGVLLCWGRGAAGQLGVGSRADALLPQRVGE
ncbi:MAG: hypothetical protein IH968_13665 [Gemmatimonadetes bacterium]|nr:hypothetical protein [Gemmatimonadota bacterium]